MKGCERMDGLEALLEAAGKSEIMAEMIDGKMEATISANGIIYAAYHGWKWYRIPKCERVIKRFCQYISIHGCTGGATRLFNTLKGMTDDDAIQWLNRTIDMYVTDKVAMVEYSLETVSKEL